MKKFFKMILDAWNARTYNEKESSFSDMNRIKFLIFHE
jgi:hypothetical protein